MASSPAHNKGAPINKMENPHEEQQIAIMSRIIGNVESLNEAFIAVNKSLNKVNTQNVQMELAAQLWTAYGRNAAVYLENNEEEEALAAKRR